MNTYSGKHWQSKIALRTNLLKFFIPFWVLVLSTILPAQAAPQCQTLYAGQSTNAGSVCVDNTQDMLSVVYHTQDGWMLGDLHLFIGHTLAEMPQTKSGNPQVGKFPLTASGDGTDVFEFNLPLGDYGTYGDTLVIAAHAVVSHLNADGSMRSETGWADGSRVVLKGNWATYFTYVIKTPIVPLIVEESCSSTETAFAFGDQTLQDLGNRINRWGWQITVDDVHGFSGQVPLYAGAAHNDPNNGTYVGTLNYSYSHGILDVNYTLFSGFSLIETHVYAGNIYVNTGAPGQFGNTHDGLAYGTMSDNFQIIIDDPENDGIYLVGHASVCIH